MTSPPLIFGPIPPYQNVPIEPQYYKPRQFFISGITLGSITTITTSLNNDYVIGQLVRLLIPNGYGSRILNEQLGYVISIPNPNQVSLNINSLNSDAFINANLPTRAQIVAVGDINSGYINPSAPRYIFPSIPGAFKDISPH